MVLKPIPSLKSCVNTLRIASTVVAPDAESAIWFNASSTSSGCRPASFISVGAGSANTTTTGPREAKRATLSAVSRHRTRSTNRPASSVLTYTTTRQAVGSNIVSGLEDCAIPTAAVSFSGAVTDPIPGSRPRRRTG